MLWAIVHVRTNWNCLCLLACCLNLYIKGPLDWFSLLFERLRDIVMRNLHFNK